MGLVYIYRFVSYRMQGQKRLILPAQPACTDPLSIEIYNEHRMDGSVKNLFNSYLTAHLPPNRISALVLGGRCGLLSQILLPHCQQIDIVEQAPFLSVLQARFSEGKEIDYFFGKEGRIGCRHVYPAPVVKDQQVRIIAAESLRVQGRQRYDLIVLQNPIITAQANLIEQLLATEHSILLTLMVPGKIENPALFAFFARFQRQVIPALYTPLAYNRLQNRRYLTGRREEINYHQIFAFQRKQGSSITESQLKQLLASGQTGVISMEQPSGSNPYEKKSMVDTYLAFHYGPSFFGIDNFAQACGKLCLQQAQKLALSGRALDLGCAVGRTTIQLAAHFDEVVGIDFSQAFVNAAEKVLTEQHPQYASKVKFVQGDACNLQKSMGQFNLIFGGNLVDRLPDPAAFLLSVSRFLQPGGVLILTSPYTWLAEYTPPDKWLCRSGEQEVGSADEMGRLLGECGIRQYRERDNLRFVIKKNDWVYDYTLANVTFWRRQ